MHRAGFSFFAMLFVLASCNESHPGEHDQAPSSLATAPSQTTRPLEQREISPRESGELTPRGETIPIYTVEGPPVGNLGKNDLGALFDNEFRRLSGSSPFAGAPVATRSSSISTHSINLVDNARDFNLNVGLFKIISARYSKNTKQRLALARNYIEKRYHELQVHHAPPGLPRNAMYFLSKVTEGHLYEFALLGSKRVVAKGFGADLEGYMAGDSKVDIGTLQEETTLKAEAITRGLLPTGGDTIFCSPQDISSCYTMDPHTQDAIALTYRLLPGKQPPANPKIKFGSSSMFPGKHRIVIVSAKISRIKDTGKQWDDDGPTPDPFVVVYKNKCKDRPLFVTPKRKTTLNPKWNHEEVIEVGPADHLCFRVVDKDIVIDDPVGQCTSKKLSKEKRKMVLGPCGQVEELVVRIE